MSVEARLMTYIQESALGESRQTVTEDSPLLDSGIVDSTGILELVSFIEKEFGVRIQDEEIVPEHFDTVRSIAAFIATKRGG